MQEAIPELEGSEFPDSITLLSLATHTSGLPRLPDNLLDTLTDSSGAESCSNTAACAPTSSASTVLQPYESYTVDDLFEFLVNYSVPAPPPGAAAFNYSNLGAGLLGYALESSLGVPYDELVQVRADS